MLLVLAAASIFVGTFALSAWRVLTNYGAFTCASFGCVMLLFGLTSMHWRLSWMDFAALILTVVGLAAALHMHRWRVLTRNRVFA